MNKIANSENEFSRRQILGWAVGSAGTLAGTVTGLSFLDRFLKDQNYVNLPDLLKNPEGYVGHRVNTNGYLRYVCAALD